MDAKLQTMYQKLKEHEADDFQKFYDLGYMAEGKFGCCGQCCLYPFVELLGIDENLFKLNAGYCAGIGLVGTYPCGAFNGGVMLLASIFGREFSELTSKEDMGKGDMMGCLMTMCEYEAKFKAIYGSVICNDIHKYHFGRSYNLTIPEELAEFEARGGHFDKCTSVVGNASRILARIIYTKLTEAGYQA